MDGCRVPPRSAFVAALTEGIARLADIIPTSMSTCVARLDPPGYGVRPTLWLDTNSSDDELCPVLLDVLRVLTLGPEAGLRCRPVRHLYSVG